MSLPDSVHVALQAAREALTAGDHDLAAEQAAEATRVAEAHADPDVAAHARSVRLQHLYALGRYGEALLEGRRALQAWQGLQQPEEQAQVLCVMSATASELDLDHEALSIAHQAFDLARRHGLAASMIHALALLGTLHGRLEDHETGERLLLQSLSRAREHHDAVAVMRSVNALLSLLVAAHAWQLREGLDEVAAATARRMQHHARTALALADQHGHTYRRAVLRSNAGAALAVAGHLGEAQAPLLQSWREAAGEGLHAVALKSGLRLVNCQLQRGELETAAALCAELMQALRPDDPPTAQIELREMSARIAAAQGDKLQAMALSEVAAGLRQQRDLRPPVPRQTLEDSATKIIDALANIDRDWAESGLTGLTGH